MPLDNIIIIVLVFRLLYHLFKKKMQMHNRNADIPLPFRLPIPFWKGNFTRKEI